MGRGTPQGSAASPSSVLSNETSAGSQGLSSPRTEPAGAGATCSCVRKHPNPALAQANPRSLPLPRGIPEGPCLG